MSRRAEEGPVVTLARRELFELGAAVGLALLAGRSEPASAVESGSEPPGTKREAHDDLLRMQEEVRKALKKPVEQRSWIMVVDGRKCVGCQACVVACVAENVLPPGVTYRSVPEIEYGSYPEVKRYPMPTQCMQCDKPPCMAAANAIAPGSIMKRPDGIVAIDYTRFRGRKAFEAAAKVCPYRALYYDDGAFYTKDTPQLQPYEKTASHDWDRQWVREPGQSNDPPAGGGRKCHFCLHRLNAGLLPICVSTCIGRALYFGDKNDPQGLVNEILAANKGKILRIREDRGTEPRVYYLTDDPQFIAGFH